MKKYILLLFFNFLVSLFCFSQDYTLFKYKLIDTLHYAPISFAEICIHNEDTVIHCVNSDFDGMFSFIANSLTIDSIFIKIGVSQDFQKYNDIAGNKLYIKEITPFKHHILTSFYITLFELSCLTNKEYKKYRKRNVELPSRKNSLAKDVD
jgi:hypothetical protein